MDVASYTAVRRQIGATLFARSPAARLENQQRPEHANFRARGLRASGEIDYGTPRFGPAHHGIIDSLMATLCQRRMLSWIP
jgi:hypothetical protein